MSLNTNMTISSYIVLIGDVGAGKATIVEKLTGAIGRSSDASESVTISSEPFFTHDRGLIISDTPGANPMSEKLEHNLFLADALNLRPVSKYV